jgi:hypothetical protein
VEQSSKGPSPESQSPDADERTWRYETPIPIDENEYPDEERVGTAWLQLQLVHTSYRHMDAKEYRELSIRLEAIEQLFLKRPSLESYYNQCCAPEENEAISGPTAPVYDTSEVRHVGAIQVQFLEDMFYVLELDRHANAPDNRGWMNLFRRWGRSPTFNHRLDALRSTLTLGFLEFYDFYLRYHPCRIDEKPIPHPWDAKSRRRDYRGRDRTPSVPPTGGAPGPCGEPSTRESTKPGDLFPGLFLDSGIKEVEDRSPTDPDARSGQDTVGSPGGGGPVEPKGPASGLSGSSTPDTGGPPSDPSK